MTLNLFQQAHPDDRNQSRGKTQSHISINKFQSRILQYVDCYKLSLYKHNTIFICDIESFTLGHWSHVDKYISIYLEANVVIH